MDERKQPFAITSFAIPDKSETKFKSFQTILKTFLKEKNKIINALELPYSNAKLKATNNLIKVINRNAFSFRNFDNFKSRILVALNIKKERTNSVLSRVWLYVNPLQLTKSLDIMFSSGKNKKRLQAVILRQYRSRNPKPSSYREDRIRTCDTLVPNQVLYQAELLPDDK